MNLSKLVSSSQSESIISPAHTGADSRTKHHILYETPPLASISCVGSSISNKTYSRPQLPLSPPVEDQVKCSLPSISSLLQGADRSCSTRNSKRQRPNPPSEINVHGEKRLRSHSYASSAVHGSRGILPPTPPLRPDSGFHSTGHSPTGSFASSASFHLSSATGNATRHSSISSSEDPLRRRSSHLSLSPQSAHPSFSQGLQSPFPGPLYPSPNIGSQKPLSERPQLPPTIYYQQPPPSAGLPLNRVPITITPAAHNTPMISPGNPAWQHHHYFPPSNAAPYPQSNDRYICRTCHKAFSRPSSLRIHSHSHTGEKPFRCPHVGCGKAFSVRSNMKRHERGCHSGRSVAPVLA